MERHEKTITEKCKYCDRLARYKYETCSACGEKLEVVRRLIEAGRELMRRLDELEEIEKASQKGGGEDG